MPAHTPGPWVSEQDGKRTMIYAEKPRRHVAVVNRRSVDEVANARLIAAAPALLEALENIMGYLDKHGAYVGPGIDAARTAIAQTKGETV